MTELGEARNRANQIVTATVYRDKELAIELVKEYADDAPVEAFALILVLSELAAWIHHQWAAGLYMDTKTEQAAWVKMMADVAEWVEGKKT